MSNLGPQAKQNVNLKEPENLEASVRAVKRVEDVEYVKNDPNKTKAQGLYYRGNAM